MPLTIKGVSSASGTVPTHEAGDLLVSFTQAATSAASGWTVLATKSTTWAYDTLTLAYRVATSSSTNAPFTIYGTANRTYSISGAKTSDPIAGYASGQGAAWSWSDYRNTNGIISSVPVPGAVGVTDGSVRCFPSYVGYASPEPIPFIAVGGSAGFTMGTGDFTIECWYKASGFSGNDYLFDLGSNGTRVQFYSNQVYFNAGGANSTPAPAGVGFTSNTWYHLAMVRSGNTVTGYINGTSVASMTYSGNMTDTGCRIGAFGGGNTNHFNGYISNFRIVKGFAVYTSNFTPSGPLGAISGTSLLTCTSPTAVADSSGNGLTVTAGDSAIPTYDSPFSSIGNGIRLTFAAAYGGGGNPAGLSSSPFIGGPGLTRVAGDAYSSFFEGGVGQIRVHYQPGYAGGNMAWATMSVNPAPTSGFFSMF